MAICATQMKTLIMLLVKESHAEVNVFCTFTTLGRHIL